MVQDAVKSALLALDLDELSRVSRVVDRHLAGVPILAEGGLRHRSRSGRGADFLDFHAYTSGDDAHSIDWRASARSAHPLIRRFHDDSSSEWVVCIDRSASMMADRGDKWILATRLAAAMLYMLLHRNNRAGLITFSAGIDNVCPPGRGRVQFETALAILANATPSTYGGESRIEACAARLRRKTSVVVISDFLAPDFMRGGLEQLRGLGGKVRALQVLSNQEVDLDLSGNKVLRDIESGEELQINSGKSSPVVIAVDRLNQLKADLERYCRQNDIAHTACLTGQDWKLLIINHLTHRHGAHA